MLRATLILLSLIILLLVNTFNGVSAEFDPKNPRVEDRLAIEDLLTRYCHSVDTKNWSEFAKLFTDDARIDYTASFMGEVGNVKQMTRFLSDSMMMFSLTIHVWTNAEIQFTGPNEAYVRAHLINPMYIYGFPVYPLFTIRGYYHHTMTKGSDGVWRSKHLKQELTTPWHNQVIGIVLFVTILWKTRRQGGRA